MKKTSGPSEAQVLADLINGEAKVETIASQRAISARINLMTLARVDAMAQKAGKSRNDMLNMLLDVGCEEVYQHLPSPAVEDLQARELASLTSEA